MENELVYQISAILLSFIVILTLLKAWQAGSFSKLPRLLADSPLNELGRQYQKLWSYRPLYIICFVIPLLAFAIILKFDETEMSILVFILKALAIYFVFSFLSLKIAQSYYSPSAKFIIITSEAESKERLEKVLKWQIENPTPIRVAKIGILIVCGVTAIILAL